MPTIQLKKGKKKEPNKHGKVLINQKENTN
jgi:hypothetical protein